MQEPKPKQMVRRSYSLRNRNPEENEESAQDADDDEPETEIRRPRRGRKSENQQLQEIATENYGQEFLCDIERPLAERGKKI